MKKLLTIVMALITMFSVVLGVACGGNGDKDSTLTIFRWDFAAVDSAKKQGTAIYKQIHEKTGVTIKVITSGSTSWEEVINKKFNTGELPDIFVSYAMDRPTNYQKWIKDEAILPISDYVSETKYPNVYARLKKYDYLKERITYANGKHYALPIESSLEHGMFVRTDWIDNLNAKLATILVSDGIISSADEMTDELYEQYKFKLPDTLTEFYRLARAFTKYDPDNDGRNNTYGYTCSEENMWFNNWIFEAMSSKDVHDSTYWGIVETGDGNLTASWVTEGNKKAISFLNKLYNEGILDPDYIGTTSDQKNTNFVQGKVGIMVGNIWYNTILQKMKDAKNCSTEEAKNSFTIIAPPAGENGVSGMRGYYGFWCSVCISNKLSAHKRDLALSFMDYLYSDEADELFTYGVEGVHYKVENGEKVSIMGQDSNGFNNTLETKDAAFALSTLSKWSYSYYSPYQSNAEEIIGFMNKAKEYTKVDPVGYVQTPLYVSRSTTISNSAMETFVNMIKNTSYYNDSNKVNVTWSDLYSYNSAYDKAWTDHVNQYLTSWGGQEMMDEYNEVAKQYLNKD